MTSSVQTLLIDMKTGPLQQPTEVLKIRSEGRLSSVAEMGVGHASSPAEASCICLQEMPCGRP